MICILVLSLLQLCSLCGAGNAEICNQVQYVERGNKGTIYCSFGEDSHGIYWYDTLDVTEHPIFYLEDNVKSGKGFTSGEFDIHANGSLIISNVSLGHEHNFTVLQLQRADSNPIVITIQVFVTVHPALPYPVISYCNGIRYCYYYAKDSSPVVCFVNKTRPLTQLSWNLRTTNDDHELVFHTEYIQEGKLFTSLITVNQSVVNPINFQLLVCKAKSGESSLINEDAIVLIEIHTPDVNFLEAVVEKHPTNKTIILPCSLDESLFFVWKRRINGTNFKLLVHGSYGSTVYESNQYSLTSKNALSIPFLSDELEGIYVCFYGNGTDEEMSVYNVSISDIKGSPQPRTLLSILMAFLGAISLLLIGLLVIKRGNCLNGYYSVPTKEEMDGSKAVSNGDPENRQELNAEEMDGAKAVSNGDTDLRQELNGACPEMEKEKQGIKKIDSTTINASLVNQGTPAIYELKYSSKPIENSDLKIRKCHIGERSQPSRRDKVILFVGETGAGKTTLINALVNYLLGVKWEDDFRYKLPLVDEDKTQSHRDSQTQWISVYTFHEHRNDINFDITFIDTPGLGDTNGESRDEEIMAQIRGFFTHEIDHLNMIAFVKKVSDVRVTNRVTYITSLVQNFFGKDVENSIYLFGTYASVSENEKFIDTAKQFKFTPKDIFFFCNEPLYLNKDVKNYKALEPKWTMGWDSFISFTNALSAFGDISLTLTREVGNEKNQLKQVLSNFPKLLKSKVIEYNALQAKQDALLRKSDENDQLVCQYEETYEETVKTKLSDDEWAIVCVKCQRTCCYPCEANYVWTCPSLRAFSLIIGCEKCESRCSSFNHYMKNFIYERNVRTRTITNEALEEKLKSERCYNIAEAVSNVEESKDNKKKEIAAQVETIRDRIKRINRLSLASDNTTVKQFLQAVIQKETNNREAGWKDRVEFLNELVSLEI